VQYAIGRENPVVNSDGIRHAPTFDLTVKTTTFEAYQGMLSLLHDGSPLLLQVAYPFTDVTEYWWVAVADATEQRRTRDLGDMRRVWTLPCTVTDPPSGLLLAQRTWSDALAEFDSWQDVVDTYDRRGGTSSPIPASTADVYPVTARYLDARPVGRRSTKATHRNLDHRQVDAAQGVRRSASSTTRTRRYAAPFTLTLAASKTSLWDALDTPGGEITVTKVPSTSDGSPRRPARRVRRRPGPDRLRPGDSISLTCPDRWLKVQRNKFGLTRSSVAGNYSWQEIQRLVEACWGGSFPFPGWASLDTSRHDEGRPARLGRRRPRRRDQHASAADSSLEVFFDAAGQGRAAAGPVARFRLVPVWRVDAGSARRARRRGSQP
jgi:hypothetical protein